jgi:aspartyl protease family protein
MAAVFQQFSRLNMRQVVLLVLAVLSTAAQAQSVVLAGRMGERALLVVGGQALTVGVGQTAGAVKLRRWVGADAEVEHAGQVLLVRAGGAPAQVNAEAPRPLARELVITAGLGGHFTAQGSINGKPVRFMVDTGASLVALGVDDAERMGIDLNGSRETMTQTANGAVKALMVNLNSVRVGDLELTNVGAVVLPQPMPMVLLGNSFLARLQMRRDNDVMRLERR